MAARRSPGPDQRRRDAERSRARILEAALIEFSEHGFAAARTNSIAARAGVNPQLISYYFDGKAGLYAALAKGWQLDSAVLKRPDLPLDEVVVNFVSTDATSRAWARLFVWQGLTGGGGLPEGGGYFADMVDDVRQRQRHGELDPELDPATVLVVLFAAALAPVALPHLVRGVSGQTPDSPEFLQRYTASLRLIVERLRPRAQAGTSP